MRIENGYRGVSRIFGGGGEKPAQSAGFEPNATSGKQREKRAAAEVLGRSPGKLCTRFSTKSIGNLYI